jgi:Type III secretion basal body protein I, YscI, HrpB, PscI
VSPATSTVTNSTGPANGASQSKQLQFDTSSADGSDGAQFRAALGRHIHGTQGPGPNIAEGNKVSLGDRIISRATNLAGEIKNDQQHVSKMLEQATQNADSMQLMKAMMALNDYEMRVQFISKTASKATQSLDQLTKLQ